jgi:CheY-like chemotaxis protein/tRNA A-37 threonylcarbamoyl transferase component Bud32
MEHPRIANYELLERLGQGGMGTVYKARHRRMNRLVALKVLAPDAGESETFLQRFARECEALAQLSHPNIVMAFDAGEAEDGPFLVMEYVNGRDLGAEVDENGPLTAAAAVSAIVQAGRGLAYAHGKGVIHRDVKPSNLLRDADGVVKVADLGLARLSKARRAEGERAVTAVGGFVGTMEFTSPEQGLDATGVDERTDVYSLGCTLFFLLTGRAPYAAATPVGLLFKHTTADIPSLLADRPDVPAELDAVFQKMLGKTPDERYPSMAEAVKALEGVSGLSDVAPPAFLPPLAATEGEGALLAPTVVGRPGSRQPLAPREDDSALDGAAHGLGAPPAEEFDPGDLVVVVAEPSRTQAGIIRRYLQELGVKEIHPAGAGRQAMALVKETQARVLISAMHLPDMTALDLARTLRAEPASSGVGLVLVTSESAAGALAPDDRTVLMHKPFDRRQLAGALARVRRPTGSAGGQAPPRPVLRVLIVDDSSAARAHVQAVLRGLGFQQFREANDGAEAAAILEKERFDLIVTDYHMPRLDGRELVLLVRRGAAPSVPVVMVTTETGPAFRESMRQAGVSAVCEKSFAPEVVRDVLARLL